MSTVKIQGNASGTGILTISAPNTNTNRAITLPDSAGQIVLSDATTGTITASRGIGDTDVDTGATGTMTPDMDTYQNFVWTFTGNVTLGNPGDEALGQSGFFVFIQDSTGGRTLSLGSEYKTAGGAGITLSSAANSVDVVPYIVSATGSILLGAPQLAFA